ncbi:MAG: SDR family NAD(P)-dependent oxidoreductase [Deltaproteobacteria bacterium]
MQTVLVTGGSRGIGRGICQAFLEEGYNVAYTCTNNDSIHLAEEKLKEYRKNDNLFGVVCNSGIYEEVKATIKKVINRFGSLDILINNAGLRKYGSIQDITIEDWNNSVNTNINGYFYFCKEAINYLKKSDNAWIINIGSTAGRVPFAGGIAYNTTKSATNGFSDSLQLDLRNEGVRVCNICPGNVFNKDFECPEDEAWQMRPIDIGKFIISFINLNERVMPSVLEIRPTKIPEHPAKGIKSLRYI